MSGFAHLRFSTRMLPPAERAALWREMFDQRFPRIAVEPLSEGPFDAEVSLLSLPGLHVGRCRSHTAACWRRTAELVKDGDNDFALLLPLGGRLTRSQLGRDLEFGAGSAVAILHWEPATLRFRWLDQVAVWVPRASLAPLVADLEEASTRLVPPGTPALRLLRGYLASLQEQLDFANPLLCKLAVTHVQDLVALLLGATRDALEVARERGLRAARLQAIKRHVAADPGLSLDELAAREGISPRYVQMLFEEEGTTLSAYAHEQRLASAYSMLRSPRYAGWTVAAVAFESGFGDLSHFNRSFRRRFGMTPSELRAGMTSPSPPPAVRERPARELGAGSCPEDAHAS